MEGPRGKCGQAKTNKQDSKNMYVDIKQRMVDRMAVSTKKKWKAGEEFKKKSKTLYKNLL